MSVWDFLQYKVLEQTLATWGLFLLILLIAMGVLFFLLSVFLKSPGLSAAFGMAHGSTYTAIIFFGLLYTPAERVLSVLLHMISRRNELAADRFAALSTGTPEALAGALQKLAVHNLSNLRPHALTVLLHYSHPPVADRIRALRLLPTTRP